MIIHIRGLNVVFMQKLHKNIIVVTYYGVMDT